MTYPVYIGDRAGTMTVTAAGEDHLFEVICHPPEPGLWRVWVQGEGQRLALGLLEAGVCAAGFPGGSPAAGASGGPGRSPAPRGLPVAARRRRTAPAPAGESVPPGGAAGAAGRAL